MELDPRKGLGTGKPESFQPTRATCEMEMEMLVALKQIAQDRSKKCLVPSSMSQNKRPPVKNPAHEQPVPEHEPAITISVPDSRPNFDRDNGHHSSFPYSGTPQQIRDPGNEMLIRFVCGFNITCFCGVRHDEQSLRNAS
ncbi:hypothetical protein BJ508DRAFT_306902 [Ascobolus immersus RN42]|uniref:Uncharacterized protein n=1 Tax=Ascobolus immersus RN42 TaxID=1160509 RepID=A0A3N4IH04_ASCIM|nr:hypothetical protein BJ508DRAFT_306902 [Ascobolus immersus RN42]